MKLKDLQICQQCDDVIDIGEEAAMLEGWMIGDGLVPDAYVHMECLEAYQARDGMP